MTKQIDPQLKLISEYLKTNQSELFVIPEYQRSYSWEIVQCDKLWQDIETFIESGIVGDYGKKDPYFFGTIIVDCSQVGKLNLIDGQQRTTTFILLLKALLIRLQELLRKIPSDSDNRKLISGLEGKRNKILDILYKTDDESRVDILEDWNNVKNVQIIENRSVNESVDFKNDLKIIVEAESFEKAMQGCYQIKFRRNDNRYTNFFRNFKFFYQKLSEYSESQVNLFAKSFLEECQVIEIRSWQTEQAITMFNSLNSTGLALRDADIISAQMYSYAGEENKNAYNDGWRNIISSVKRLESRGVLKLDAVLQQYMYIRRALDKVYITPGRLPDVTTPGLRKYYTIDNVELLKQPLALCDSFSKIVDIWEKIQDYPVVKLLMRFNDNSRLYLISYLNRFEINDVTIEKVTEITEPLMRLFAVLELVDAGYSSSNFKTFLFGENIKLVDAQIPIDHINLDFSNHIVNKWKRDDLKQRLMEYDKNILVFLNEYVYAKTHRVPFVLTDSVNVEHIMPASGRDIETIRENAAMDKEEFLREVNKLGNKILLEDALNKALGNEWFQTKKQKSIKDKAGYKDSKYPIALALTNYPKDSWEKYDIQCATEKVAERILNFIFN